MAVNLSLFAGAGVQFFDNNGVPLSGGLLYAYSAGTTTPQATYTTNAGNVAQANPIVLDSSGRVPYEIWLTAGSTYKFVLQTASATQIGSWDNISGANDFTAIYSNLSSTSSTSQGAGLIGFKQANASGYISGSVARTVQLKLEEFLSVLDFGADATGTNDSTTAIQTAITSAMANKKMLYFPAGTYLYNPSSTFTINSELKMYGEGPDVSIVKINANNIIFNVLSQTQPPSNFFTVEGMQFYLTNPTTNNTATCFYISNGTSFGCNFNFDNCEFRYFTNCAIQAIRAFLSSVRNTIIQGNSPYTDTSGYLSTYNDAGVRIWGADGTTTTQDHSFSNLNVFERLFVYNVGVGVDAWNLSSTSFEACTITGMAVGILTRPNPSGFAVGGFVSSTEKGGYGQANIYTEACWFEQCAEYYMINTDWNLATNTAINPTKTCTMNSAGYGIANYYALDSKVQYASGYPLALLKGGLAFYQAPVGFSSILSDYEYGSWTPILGATTGTQNITVTYTTQSGVYTKIGNVVHLSGQITISAISGGSAGILSITNLPYTPTAISVGTFGLMSGFSTNYSNTNGQTISAYVNTANPYLYFNESSASANSNWPTSNLTSTFTVAFSISYECTTY